MKAWLRRHSALQVGRLFQIALQCPLFIRTEAVELAPNLLAELPGGM
jgi:hypothetical protein